MNAENALRFVGLGAVGALIGVFLALGVGVGAGAGILVGTQAGACLAFESAKEQHLLSPEEIDRVIQHAIEKIRGKSSPEAHPKVQWVESEADRAKIIAEMQKAAKADN